MSSKVIELDGLVNRTGFSNGPWDDEPDLRVWRYDPAGTFCAVTRARIGTLAGYVAVPDGNPLLGKDEFHTEPLRSIDVHGGITFADKTPYVSNGMPVARLVRQVYGFECGWWVGFDCAHAWDLQPTAPEFAKYQDYVYRSIRYVIGETEIMAEQVSALGGGQ